MWIEISQNTHQPHDILYTSFFQKTIRFNQSAWGNWESKESDVYASDMHLQQRFNVQWSLRNKKNRNYEAKMDGRFLA